MKWKIAGIRDGFSTILRRGINTLEIGEVLLTLCLDYDSFSVELDSDYEL